MKKLTILLTLLCMPLMVGWSGSGEIEVFSTGIDGLVPAPGGTTGAFLMDDGTWGAGGTPPITTDLQINSLGVGTAPTGVAGEARIKSIQPIDLSSPNVVKLPSGSSANIQEWWDAGGSTQRASLSAIGAFNTAYILANNYTSSKIYYPRNTSDDWIAKLFSDTKGFALQNTAGSDAFRFDLDGDDRKLSFLGTNTGTITWDDDMSAHSFSDAIMIKEITEPSTPPSGYAVKYLDSADGNYKIKFDDGDVVTLGSNP